VSSFVNGASEILSCQPDLPFRESNHLKANYSDKSFKRSSQPKGLAKSKYKLLAYYKEQKTSIKGQ
jgi:hypothetical protein